MIDDKVIDQMVKTSLLTTEEILLDKAQIHKLIIEENIRHKKELKFLEEQLRLNQIRCPHNKTYIQSGQYMPCVEICSVCGMEID